MCQLRSVPPGSSEIAQLERWSVRLGYMEHGAWHSANPSSPEGRSDVRSLTGARVVCLGDVMLDRTVHGEVHRISPEAPVPVLRVRRSEEALGGAGNVARNVSALGGQVTLIGAVGEDAEAASVRRLISTLPGVVDAVRAWPGRSTTTKTREARRSISGSWLSGTRSGVR